METGAGREFRVLDPTLARVTGAAEAAEARAQLATRQPGHLLQVDYRAMAVLE